ncbi:MAG: C-terminal binding protein, partial [SAR324 cluster bacterium]|nr:C-terminal binding protein [SAR324 cluster bacterium]
YKILITDYQWPSIDIEREILGALPAELLVAETGAEQELLGMAPQADAILTCWQLVSEAVIDAAPNCRIITRYGVGLDNIAVAHATRLGIPVTNAPTYCLEEVAEHALALLLALARRITRFDRALRAEDYAGVAFHGMRRISGKTMGLLGYGNIGRTLAGKARGLGMNVIVHDPQYSELPPAEGRAVDFPTLLAEADMLSVHVPLTDGTRGLLGAQALAQMKPGALLVNTSRGPVVDVDALLAALQEERLAGAALDVYPVEPPQLNHPIFQHPHFIGTPHASFYSEESVENLQRICAGQVYECLSGGTPDNIVNPDYRNHSPRFERG